MTDRKKLVVGEFYWIYASIQQTDSNPCTTARVGEVWNKPTWQPARFTGLSGDGDGRDTWDIMGLRSEDGHHFVKIENIGPPTGHFNGPFCSPL